MTLLKSESGIMDREFQKKVIDKIHQPFFTTKPAGQGTGLGLSLSYDIITKEHNEKMDVTTKENEYNEFVIELPVKAA
jgi:two-component system, NtrC family, sensor kinase